MAGQTRIKAQIRLSTARRPVRSGLGPAVVVSLITSGLLWGTGHNVPSVGSVTGRTDFRSAIAWLATTLGLLVFAYAMLGVAVGLIQGSWRDFRLTSWYLKPAIRRQSRRRDRLEGRRPTPWIEENFPLSTEAIRSTALGNAQGAVADRVSRRYGLDLDRAWPALTGLITQTKDRELLEAAELEADKAVYSAAGWLVTTIFVTPALWVLASFGMTGMGQALVPLVVAASTIATMIFYATRYRQAIDLTIAHGKLIESQVGLHRFELLERFGLRKPEASEEQEFFKALSSLLAGQAISSRFRADVLNESELTATVSELVEREVGRGLERGLKRALTDGVLDNFEGHISAQLLDDNQPVPIDNDEEFLITYARNYELVIAIAAEPLEHAATAPVVVRNGSDEHDLVPFAVSIDSNISRLRLSERSLAVSRDGEKRLAIPFRIEETNQKPWVWIRLTQHGRTIQNLELKLTGGGMVQT
jgi:hypothetical protein